MKYNRDLIQDLLSRFTSDEVLGLMFEAGFKEPKKLDIKNGWATIRCSQHLDEENPRKGKRASCVVNVNTSNFKCRSCGHSGNLIDVAKTLRNANFPEAVEYLAEIKGFDVGKSEQTTLKTVVVSTKPKEPEVIKYFTFDSTKEVRHYSNEELIQHYFELSELMKFKAIMTVIIRHSLEVSQEAKINYLCHERKIDINHPRLSLTGFLPKKSSDVDFWRELEKSFPVADLVRFGIYGEGNEKYPHPSWKYQFSDLIVFPNQDLSTDLYHGAMLRPTVKPQNSYAKEFQLSQVGLINPIPFGLNREALQCEPTILITEGGIDGYSADVCFASNPGVATYFKPYLGLYRGKTVIVGYDMDEAGQRATYGYTSISFFHKNKNKTFTKLFVNDVAGNAKKETYIKRLKTFVNIVPNTSFHQGLLQDLRDAGVDAIYSLKWDFEKVGKDFNEIKQRFGGVQKEFLTAIKF